MYISYQKELEIKLKKEKETDWIKVLEKHREMIAMIQHERLVHLLVTIFTGLVMTAVFLVLIVSEKTYLLLLGMPLLFLFIGYLLHYRFLENTTQKWYLYTKEIENNIKIL